MEDTLPPLDGSLPTIPDVADYVASRSPDRPWFVFPSKDDPKESAQISCAEMVEASHRIAHILRPGRKGPEREVIALLLNTDTVLYAAVLLGLLRAGFVPYPMSPRNSVQGVVHMLEATSCTRIMGQGSTSSLVYHAQAEMAAKGVDVRVDSLPGLENAFPAFCGQPKTELQPYPPAPAPVNMDDPSMYMHSSGSTGFPKSIHFTYRRVLEWMNHNTFGAVRGLRFGAMGMPTFHTMGMLLHLAYPLSTGNEVVVYTPQHPAPPVIAHPQSTYAVCKAMRCDALMALPSFVEAWAHDTEATTYLKALTILIYGGGPLAHSVGARLVDAGVHLANGYGGTEFGSPMLPWDRVPRSSGAPDGDWYWFRVAPVANVRFEPQGDGQFELVVVETDGYHLAVHNVPGEKAYATADLFEPHPTKAGLWKIVGRKDDVITLSTGEKVVPIPQEGIISAGHGVAGCLMFGREREQPGIIVEPMPEDAIDPDDQMALGRLRNKLWPLVEKANEVAPAFAKIFKEMIIVADLDKPLPRSAKGNVSRKLALQLYAEEIDKLYETVAESTNVKGIEPPLAWDVEQLEPWLVEQATSLVEREKSITVDGDLFQQGFDSLSATFFRNRIIGALRASEDPDLRLAARNVSANVVFEHPTITRLARAVHAAVSPSAHQHKEDALGARVAEIEALVARYTADMPAPKGKAVEFAGPSVVLLTGATGNIGSHILAGLLAEARVVRVYALNRPSADPMARLRGAFTERGLPVGLLEDQRLVVLSGEIPQDCFGLEKELYHEVLMSVTHVIHNAWTVNFNLALRSFEDQIAGVRKLVDISASADHPMQLLVTSSIGAVDRWDPKDGPVPEHALTDPIVAAGAGYGSSKYVVEQILGAASACGIAATAVRMGQACGPKATGAWGTTEWMPIMVKSGLALGCLPAVRGPVAWMPLDVIGNAYVDWVLSPQALPSLVNVVHPHPTSWDVILKGLSEELGDAVSVVSFQEWAKKLDERAVNPTAQDISDIPALKLLDFFRGLARAELTDSGGAMKLAYETAELLRSSSAMRELEPMSEDHAKAWVRYWRSKGFISN
ncbi:hypothetical protein PHLGIDRAFT_371020 [Phlebiopsis gigantea 11061_1 CR5-6]|uniref:Uncharacterized protein n=1 Tax=Phlebiopsis gigantea (strain 11061_1 CR5-6) TaxID=745531 RepID=A0A0C3P2P5_PHLG1|nr:hypothetical protein PHLGIDRAFT_371020 [Phlebiopsis gigantea 11061_1 CR5-6]